MSANFFGRKDVHLAFNIALATFCLVCYILLILIFVTPESLRLESLVIVQGGSLQPTVAVNLLAVLLIASTSALVTRCVEQSLWLKLAPREVRRPITVDESHRLAQWSVSPLARLFYFFEGNSWLLRIGGVALIAGAVLSPILLAGISQRDADTTSVVVRGAWDDSTAFAGYLDASNVAYNGGSFSDTPTTVSSLAAMRNLSAPPVSTCRDDTCFVEAQAASIFAECTSEERENPNRIGGYTGLVPVPETFCSTYNPALCVTLVKSDPSTAANFSTSYPPNCGSGPCIGEWATIFGAYVNYWPEVDDPLTIKLVDCRLQYGRVTIRQNGSSVPILDRTTFQPSTVSWDRHSTGQWRRLYNEVGAKYAPRNPYAFHATVAATGFNSLYIAPVGLMLLGPRSADPAETVARRIEKNFEMGTLFAYANSPDAAVQTITTIDRRRRWHYEPLVLLALLVPALTTILGAWGRWRVTGDDVFVGYNPVEIAKRGPIHGVIDREGGSGTPIPK